MSDTLLGICGKDFVIICADANAGFSIIVMKDNEDKISEIDNNKLLAAQGENGDRVQFSEYIKKNLNLFRLRNLRSTSTKGAASFLRGELAYYLRRAPYSTNILLGGFDKKGSSLYFIDYLAAMHKVKFAAHGYGQYFCYGIFDNGYKDDISLDEAKVLLKKCVKEIKKRFVLNTPKYLCKIVTKDGIKKVEL